MNFKLIITKERGLDVVPRQINRDALVQLGLTEQNRKKVLLGLSVADFCDGPEPDTDRAGSVWIFGKNVGGKNIYIKLKVAQVGNSQIAKCLSFHEAQRPLRYPFRETPEEGSA
ncbi:hypothetical protein ACFLQW_02525 [Candidatus Zixiibacteriota bacterium]